MTLKTMKTDGWLLSKDSNVIDVEADIQIG
jgi:hypothetical protein